MDRCEMQIEWNYMCKKRVPQVKNEPRHSTVEKGVGITNWIYWMLIINKSILFIRCAHTFCKTRHIVFRLLVAPIHAYSEWNETDLTWVSAEETWKQTIFFWNDFVSPYSSHRISWKWAHNNNRSTCKLSVCMVHTHQSALWNMEYNVWNKNNLIQEEEEFFLHEMHGNRMQTPFETR